MSAATQLIAVFDVAGMTPTQIDALEAAMVAQACDTTPYHEYPDTTVRVQITNKEIGMNGPDFGLRKWQVFQEGGKLVWEGLANGAIHAFDQYVHTVDETYGSYTNLVDNQMGGTEEWIFLFAGDIWSVLENTQIYARLAS